jgi:membrane protease YdiL (CAAX protease family)
MEFAAPLTYAIGKILMLAVPILVWRSSQLPFRKVLEHAGIRKTNMLPGLAIGAVFAGAILGAYYFIFRGTLDAAPIVEKVESLGLMKWYWLMAFFLSIENSLTEELYFRSFLHGQFNLRLKSGWKLCVLGGLLFGLHHVLPLAGFFPLPLALIFISGTVTAGAAWVWMRVKGYSLIDCYISHMAADFAILWAGWDMIQSAI